MSSVVWKVHHMYYFTINYLSVLVLGDGNRIIMQEILKKVCSGLNGARMGKKNMKGTFSLRWLQVGKLIWKTVHIWHATL